MSLCGSSLLHLLISPMTSLGLIWAAGLAKQTLNIKVVWSILFSVTYFPLVYGYLELKSLNDRTVSHIIQVSAARQEGGASPTVQMLHWFTVEKAEKEGHKHCPCGCKNYSRET